MASTLSRLSTCLNGAFDGETPTFLCDSQAVVAALKDAGLPAYSFTEMDSLEPSQLEKVVMIPIVFERTPRGSVIEKTFESTAMLVLPIASFCGTARGALYFLEMLSKIDLDRCINGNLEWLDRLETLPSIRMEGDGTDIKVEFDDEIFLMSPKTTQSIQPGEWVSIAQYLEVGLTSHRNGQRPRHTMNGTMVASGFVVASHRYAAAEVFPMQAEAWKYLRNLQGAANGAPIVVEVRDLALSLLPVADVRCSPTSWTSPTQTSASTSPSSHLLRTRNGTSIRWTGASTLSSMKRSVGCIWGWVME